MNESSRKATTKNETQKNNNDLMVVKQKFKQKFIFSNRYIKLSFSLSLTTNHKFQTRT